MEYGRYEIILTQEAQRVLHDLQHSFLRRRYPGLGKDLLEALEDLSYNPGIYRNRKFQGSRGTLWGGEVHTRTDDWLILWEEISDTRIVVKLFVDANEFFR